LAASLFTAFMLAGVGLVRYLPSRFKPQQTHWLHEKVD
jgi:hypothetical protein